MKGLLSGLAALLLLGSALGAQAQVVLRGDVHFWTYGSRVRIETEHITNFGEETTERLRFRLFASEDHWRAYDRGELIAIGALPRLRAHQNINDAHRTVHLHRPNDSGWYYVTLTLEERSVDEEGNVHWEIRDAVESDSRHYFSRSLGGLPFPF